MARPAALPIRPVLRKLFSHAWIARTARDTGAVVRKRKVDIAAFFWTLVLGFGAGRSRTLASLRRTYEKTTGQTLEESSFYDRFTDGLVRLLKRAVAQALESAVGVGRALRGPLATFRDVVLTDSTVIRLHDLLAKAYPACRTNHTKAAAKAHVILSVCGAGHQSVKLTSERLHDGPVFRVGRWVKDRLLLFDLGYFRYQLFACITRNGGYFLSRLKGHANPLIVEMNRKHRGRAVGLVGKRLREVSDRLEREIVDVWVEVAFPRRRYAGQIRRGTQRLRVVGIRDGASYHFYVTNIPPEKLAAEDIRATYALRWQIELLFRELKSQYRLEQLPSGRRAVVEALLHAAILTLIVSRRLLALLRERLGVLGERVPTQRWAALLQAVSQDLLLILLAPTKETELLLARVSETLLHEAIDPNRRRPSLLQSVEERSHRYRSNRA